MSVDGIWYVKLADGDVERVTLDQLDEAFQNGQIDESCMVLADGAQQWTKLGELLGATEAPAQPAPVPAVVQPPAAARSPFAMPSTAAPSPVAARSPFAMQPAAVVAPPAVAARPQFAAQAPMAMRPPPAMMPAIPVASSLRPVSFDLASQLDLGPIEYPAAPSRKRWVVGALGTALVVGAGAFFVVSRTASSAASDPAPVFAAAAVQPPPAPVPPPQPEMQTPPSSPQAMNAGPSSVMDPTQQPRLTDDQKRKLLETEKSAKSHVKSHGGGGGGGSYHAKEKSTGFTTDGNKFDPLNSTL